MLPSWFTKLKDVKAVGKQSKEQDPTKIRKRWQEATTSLTNSLSLRRASSKGRNTHFDCEVTEGAYPVQDVVRPSTTGNESDACKTGQFSHELPCLAFAHSSSLKFETGTEEFAFMSETSSTFGSEMSSADLSISSKCSSCCEEYPQGDQVWQQRSGDALLNLQKNVGELSEVKVTDKLKDDSICAILSSRSSQASAGIQLSILHEMRSAGHCGLVSRAVGEKDGEGTGLHSRNGNQINWNAQKGCCSTHSSSLAHANGVLLRSGEYGYRDLADKYANEEHIADRELQFTCNRNRKMEASCSRRSKCIGDKDKAFTVDESSLALDGCSLQNVREAADCLPKDLTATNEGTGGVLQIRLGEGSQSIAVKMQRKRQRGSSISSVLPPDLQGLVGDSLAFVKISEDPYEDFKQSMYEMIMETGLAESMDVEELLYCYLTLNSPEHHELIKEAFSDVWTSVLKPSW